MTTTRETANSHQRWLEFMLKRELVGAQRPRVLPLFVDRDVRGRKTGVSKHAYGDRYETRQPVRLPVHRRTALGTEMESSRFPAIASPRPLRRAALHRQPFSWEARLGRKNAAGPLLAFQAMTNGNSHGLALAGNAKLSAAA